MAKDSTAVVGPEPTASNTKVAGAKWNDEAHQALCGTLLEVVEGAGTSWRAHLGRMVELMGERGHTFTREGIRQHLQKLKRKDNASGNGNGEAATPKKARTTPKKRGKAADEDADSETPKTKKRRGPNKKAAAADDEDVDEEKGSFVKDEDDDSC